MIHFGFSLWCTSDFYVSISGEQLFEPCKVRVELNRVLSQSESAHTLVRLENSKHIFHVWVKRTRGIGQY